MERSPLSEETLRADDFRRPEVQRERLLGQDAKLLEAVGLFAARIHALPSDPQAPDLMPRTLLVGGFVRDALLGKHPKDADLEVYGVRPDRLEATLDQYFPGAVNKVGKSFGIYKIHVTNGIEFDISIPRRESKSGKGHRGFTVEGDPAMSIQEAARRRDFTFNALAADPLTGEVIDHFGGVEDLANRTLRATDPERFQDDALRVYRAVQFAARMDLKVAPETRELMRAIVERGDLDELSPERVTEEWKKMLLKSERPSVGFELARDLGVIEKYYPELHALIGTPQEPEWHPEGDVWVHNNMVVDAAAKIIHQPERGFSEDEQVQVMVGAENHDLGKPSTTELIDGRVRSRGHEEAGIDIAEKMLSRLTFGESVKLAAMRVAGDHLKPDMLWRSTLKKKGSAGYLDEKQYVNAVRKLLKRIAPVSWRVLLAVSEADFRGRGVSGVATAPYEAGIKMHDTISREGLGAAPTKLLVRGRDIIDTAKRLGLDVAPGPRFRELIAEVETLRDTGEISTSEEAIAALEHILRRDGR